MYLLAYTVLVLSTGIVFTKERLSLDILTHFPHYPWNKESGRTAFLEFPSGKKTDPDYKKIPTVHSGGCYKLGGEVLVRKDLVTSRMQAYLEVMYPSSDGQKVAGCKRHNDTTGCGGWGSCVYCDPCNSSNRLNESSDKKEGFTIRSPEINTAKECPSVIKRGYHRNININFCLPSKRDFLEFDRISEKAFNRYFKQAANARTSKLSVFITIYIYARPINERIQTQRREEDKFRDENPRFHSEAIPNQIKADFSFEKIKIPWAIACHKIIGNIFVANDNEG